MPSTYATQRRHEVFRQDFSGRPGYRAEYQGRHFYSGPALEIEASDLQEVIRATTLRLRWDAMGKSGLIVYPA